jgi:hypothetical protein
MKVQFCIVLFLVVISCFINSTNADDGLLTRVGSAEDKTFYTSLWGHDLTWIQAQEFCNQAQPGMQLASIETERERQVIYMFFVSNAASRVYYEFWLSGTDWNKEGEFSYTRSGSAVPFTVIQDGGNDGKEENCLKINYDARFFDESCFGWTNNQIWPLCEIKRNGTVPSSTTQAPQPTTAAPTTTTTPAPPAPFECKEEGMHADPLECSAYHVCIAHQGGFIDHKLNCPEFTNYCAEQAVCGYPADCPCDAQAHAPIDFQKYSDFMKKTQAVVNKNPSNPATPPASELEVVGTIGSKTYYTDKAGRNLNWIQSFEHCHQLDLSMGTMETDQERALLLSHLRNSYYVDMFWLAALDYGSEGSYYWANDGRIVNRPIYGNGGRASNCLYLYKTGPVYDWSCDYHKSTTLWPLCQKVEA